MKKRIQNAFLFCFTIIRKLSENELFYMANALTYRIIMAFFPFLICLLSLCSFINLDSMHVINFIMTALPGVLSDIILVFIENAHIGNTIFSASLFYGIWSATIGFHTIIMGMNKCCGVKEERNLFVIWLLSLFLVIIFIVYIIFNLIFVVFEDIIFNFLVKNTLLTESAVIVKNMPMTIIAIALTIAFVLIIYECTAAGKLKFKELLPGALFTIGMWIILSVGLKLYIYFNKRAFFIYGSISGIFMTLFWVNMLGLTLLAGAQLNGVLINYKKLKAESRRTTEKYKKFLKGKLYEKKKD